MDQRVECVCQSKCYNKFWINWFEAMSKQIQFITRLVKLLVSSCCRAVSCHSAINNAFHNTIFNISKHTNNFRVLRSKFWNANNHFRRTSSKPHIACNHFLIGSLWIWIRVLNWIGNFESRMFVERPPPSELSVCLYIVPASGLLNTSCVETYRPTHNSFDPT